MALERRPLTRTLEATVMGLGTGGFSRAGLDQGLDHAAGVVAHVIEAGVDLVDTSEGYGTERAVAEGVRRAGVEPSAVVVATKYRWDEGDEVRPGSQLETIVRERLAALGRDHLDLLQVHAVTPQHYRRVRDAHLPVLERLRDAGVITAVGITEAFTLDPQHQTLAAAIADGCWDTVMVGYNLLNPSARELVIASAAAKGIGVLVMFAVRQALVDVERLRAYLADQAPDLDVDERISRLEQCAAQDGGSLTDLAYRFAAATPGVSSVLVGSGNVTHLTQNLAAFQRPPLDPGLRDEVGALFADVGSLTGQVAARPPRDLPANRAR